MRRLIQSLVISAALVGASVPFAAHADLTADGSAIGSTDSGAGGLLNGNVTVFGVPDPETGAFSPKVGIGLEGSLYSREWGGDGPCTASVGIGNVSAEASVGVGLDPFFEREYGPGATNPKPDAKSPGGPGAISCTLSAEASLISIEGECKTPVGTFGASAQGVGAEASCGCDGCVAEAYWAKAEGSYTTPSIGGCGIKGSVTVTGGVMAGVGVGAERVGDAGGGITLGPFEVGAGVNIDEFNLGEAAGCIGDAAVAIGNAAVAVGEGIVDIGSSIIGGIGDVGSSIIGGIGDLGGGIIDGIGGLFGGGGGGGGGLFGGLFGGGDNSPRNAPTRAIATAGTPNAPTANTAGGAGWSGALGRN